MKHIQLFSVFSLLAFANVAQAGENYKPSAREASALLRHGSRDLQHLANRCSQADQEKAQALVNSIKGTETRPDRDNIHVLRDTVRELKALEKLADPKK